ncbi:ecto-NOX disulfide-thiol exchanger 2-like isoform X2 [Stegodyphus dumicola]|uniref:ecto-NOX disulfide-thiol exchanger 2-like isoform X2 n=1 Tax=Stegodyphus dumicola TaxID=202533 RepID=UPI0015A7C5BE|nr:ecto-NOX disulfide-thiol exchanger 2-like isoform X2 [Stegodyphus dumicola]XP_035228735.1 ecto-NOX disulfide-thiol exchanger 2-like isoform X2 [Stegodyphus dumicola]
MEENIFKGRSPVKYDGPNNAQCAQNQGKENHPIVNQNRFEHILGRQILPFQLYGDRAPSNDDSHGACMSLLLGPGMAQSSLNFSRTEVRFNMASSMETFGLSSGFAGMQVDMFREVRKENVHRNNGTNRLEKVSSAKSTISLSKSTLYPPHPFEKLPAVRNKPTGCKTVYVGGLPNCVTEEIIKEVFERCGEILMLHMGKKNSCSIRFASEAYVENAVSLSGYRMKIENKDDDAYVGKLSVDYGDEYEFKCQQRAFQMEVFHRDHLNMNKSELLTPQSVVPYSERKAVHLIEKLHSENTFKQAVVTLVTWLEKGECNKKNSSIFFSLIQSVNGHIKKLINEKGKYEDRVKTEGILKQQMQADVLFLNECEKVFNAASLQKVWDQFTKAQRKHIKHWKKLLEVEKCALVEALLQNRIEDEMDLSDDENFTKESQANSTEGSKYKNTEEIKKLREENHSLRCQLEASQNELGLLQSKSRQEKDMLENHLKVMREAIQGQQKEILHLNEKLNKEEIELQALKSRYNNLNSNDNLGGGEVNVYNQPKTHNIECGAGSSSDLTQMEVHLITLISVFLYVRPFGASSENICYYLRRFYPTVIVEDVENLMKRFPSIYKESFVGIGASLARKWFFSFSPLF